MSDSGAWGDACAAVAFVSPLRGATNARVGLWTEGRVHYRSRSRRRVISWPADRRTYRYTPLATAPPGVVATVPGDAVRARLLLAGDAVDGELGIPCLLELVGDEGLGVEGIGVVLGQAEGVRLGRVTCRDIGGCGRGGIQWR